jgi:signal transduction histidine kinase
MSGSMKAPPILADEAERLAALRRYELLDTLPEQEYDDLTQLAAHICGVPIALVTLVDADRLWFKSRVGLPVAGIDRAQSFCSQVVVDREMMIIPDASCDERFARSPLVTGYPDIRFYAGTPLISQDGHALGTLCVVDLRPRQLDGQQIAMLRALGRQVMSQIELRLHLLVRAAMEKAKDEFVSVVSHELRTPLTSIRGSLGLIEGGALGTVPPELARMVAIARANTDRLVRLINDILDLEKIAAGKLELKLRPLDPADLVDAALTETQGIAGQARVDLAWSAVEPGGARLLGDRDRLIQVLVNLLSNAIKVSPPGGGVAIRIESAGGRVRITVRDRGPGIAARDLSRIFGRFQQIDSSDSRSRGGTGLGLSICKAIVEEHGGTIGVDTAEGEGSDFWFEIPGTS